MWKIYCGPWMPGQKNNPSRRLSRPIHLRWLVTRLLLIFVLAWTFSLGGLSGIYVRSLMVPPCPASLAERPGYQSVTIATSDGYHLRGWWRPPQNGAVILLLAGNGGSRDSMLGDAELLARHGYGVLTLEYRNCQGGAATLGYLESTDLAAMLDFAQSQPDVAWVGVLGFSAGGAAAILGAADLPGIGAVVAEGHYASLHYEITNANSPVLSPAWQVQQWVAGLFWVALGRSPRQISPLDTLPRLAPRPVLLIFGEFEADNNRAFDQLAAAGPAAQMWIVPGSGHGGYVQLAPLEYEQRIIAFFDSARH